MAKTKQQIQDEKNVQMYERREADDYWWLVVRNPNREIHLYELGYAGPGGALTEERHAVIMGELGAPADASPETGWELSIAPGRPERYLEPKEYDTEGELLPIKARAGVTLHLAPEDEPGVGDGEE